MLADRVRMGIGRCTKLGPGPQKLIGGNTDAGYFGIVPASELITGDALATLVGISAGTPQFSNEGWLKFYWQGIVEFVAKKPIRYGISWTNINNANCASGEVTQIVLGKFTYKVRLMSGLGPYGSETNYKGTGNYGSEWNELMLPIHVNAPSNWGAPGTQNYSNVDIPTNDWGVGFTDSDLHTDQMLGNGASSWCQEMAFDQYRHLTRGYDGVASANFNANNDGVAYPVLGWRPVLELVI